MKRNKKENLVQYRQDADFFFKVGLKYTGRNQFLTAQRYLSKAVEIDRFNADYVFNLACVMAELKEAEKSNKLFSDIIKNIDPTFAECYFGIACNYFDSGNFKKAREYFDKYILFDNDGQFADDAYDIIHYLKIYEDIGYSQKRENTSLKVVHEGIELMKSALYNKAYSKLEKAVEVNPEAVIPRIYLALACYIQGDIDRAFSVTKSVLKLEANNVFAHCNLAILCAGIGDGLFDTQLKTIHILDINNEENFSKEMAEYIEIISQIKDIDDKSKNAVIKELENKKIAVNNKNVPGQPLNSEISLTKKLVKLDNEWNDIIKCALQNKEFEYDKNYKSELEAICIDFINNVYIKTMPRAKKKEIWAAVLEYIYCCHNLIKISKKRLALKYHVSASSITKTLKDFDVQCNEK